MRVLNIVFTSLIVSLCSLESQAKGSNTVDNAGISLERLARVETMMQNYIDEKRYPGMVTLVAHGGEIVFLEAAGNKGLVDTKPVKTDSLFRIYSMTKPVTGIAALMLYEKGLFRLDDPVAQYLPELKDVKVLKDGKEVSPSSPITIRQLFTHTAGFTYGFTPDNPVDIAYNKADILNAKDSGDFLTKLAALPLRFEPGTRYHYSVSYDVLGILIERLSNKSLAEFFEDEIFVPLGMQDTFFNVPSDKLNRLAGDHFWDLENKRVLPVPLESQRDFSTIGFFSGGGGLVSTAEDYLKFAQMVLNQGQLDGVRLLGRKTIELMSMNHLDDEARLVGAKEYPNLALHGGQTMGLGFGVVFAPEKMPAMASKGELSWAGAAGTKFWIDPKEQIVAIALVQLYQAPWPLRYDLKTSVYQALN